VVPVGGSNETGALGYADCAQELAGQAATQGLQFDAIVLASSSGGTQGGLLAGLAAIGHPARVIGIDVDAEPDVVAAEVRRIAEATLARLDPEGGLADDAAHIESGHAGAAYGLPTEDMRKAVELVARLEGIALIDAGRFTADERVVFLHSGGTPAIFAYRSVFDQG
jgi:1-aminocyclopropane-1-carboxylate deaminase/D-cysteine desulfhydrase-like pyridoxal-dependent ACC family enzyme